MNLCGAWTPRPLGAHHEVAIYYSIDRRLELPCYSGDRLQRTVPLAGYFSRLALTARKC